MPNPERSDLPPSVAESENLPVVPHLPRRSERAQNVIDFVRQSTLNGQLLPPLSELAGRFGYNSRESIRLLLRKEGLPTSRKGRSEKPCQIPPPSSELAWMIGILAGGGSNRLKSGTISISTHNNDEFLTAVKSTVEGMFALNAIVKENQVKIQSTQVSRFLGDLHRDNWPSTILNKHGWILQNQEYLWSLIRGFFDTKGDLHTYARKGRHVLMMRTTFTEVANFVADVLVQLGIKEVRIKRHKQVKSGISGIEVYGLGNIRLFANHVHSTIADKEADLDFYRGIPLAGKRKVYTVEEGIEEWIQITQRLGRSPSHYEIRNLKRTGRTRFSQNFYSDRFGQGSFVKARENLERIVLEKEAN